jgi:hypothetical protein
VSITIRRPAEQPQELQPQLKTGEHKHIPLPGQGRQPVRRPELQGITPHQPIHELIPGLRKQVQAQLTLIIVPRWEEPQHTLNHQAITEQLRGQIQEHILLPHVLLQVVPIIPDPLEHAVAVPIQNHLVQEVRKTIRDRVHRVPQEIVQEVRTIPGQAVQGVPVFPDPAVLLLPEAVQEAQAILSQVVQEVQEHRVLQEVAEVHDRVVQVLRNRQVQNDSQRINYQIYRQ